MKTAAQEERIQLVPVTRQEADTQFEAWTEIRNRISRRAFEIFEERGRVHGYDLDDWFKAESEVVTPVQTTVNETEHLYTITLEVSGFKANELEIRAEPFRIFILGKKSGSGRMECGKTKEIFKPIIFCNQIETNTVIAELSDGQLTISIRKAFVPVVVKHPKENSKELQTRSAQLRKRADIAKRYAAAAKDQLRRATAKEKKARSRTAARQARASLREKETNTIDITDIRPNIPWTEETPHSPLG